MIGTIQLRACSFLAAVLLPAAVLAASPQAADPSALDLDQTIQKLKDKSLDIIQQAQPLELSFLYPDHNRVSVYVSVSIPGMLIKDISASIDGATPVSYQYRESESVTLQERGLHLLLQMNAAAGQHRLQAQYTAQYSDARPGAIPFSGSYDGYFDKTDQAADLELELQRPSNLARPELKFHDWKAAPGPADVFVPGDDNDPRVRAAQYLAGNNRYLSAVSLLDQVQADAEQKPLSPDYYRELAADALSFGMPQRAESIYREQVASAGDAPSLARARLHLADFYYERGYYSQAASELTALRPQLPPDLLGDWQDLQSRVFLAQGRYGEAAEVLDQVNGNDMTQYMRYNLGVALVNDGRVEQGVSMLDRVGRLSPTDSDSLALRDKANLTLGYYFLKMRQGGTAVPIFGRVRTEGPYSNRALLGLGWAYLAPHGSTQKKSEVGDEQEQPDTAVTSFATIGVLLRPGYTDSGSIYKRAGLAPFHLSGKAAEEEAQLKQALVPWVELTGRDTIDPAVQEGLLAIPYVLDHLGAHLQAQQYYERAIAALEETRGRLDKAEEHVHSGRMVLPMVDNYDPASELGWRWKLKSLPITEESFYLQTLIADHAFQEELKNFRDTRLLQHELEFWKARLDELQQSFQTPGKQGISSSTVPPGAKAPEPGLAPGPEVAQQMQLSNRLGAYQGNGATALAEGTAPLLPQLAQPPGADQLAGAFERMQALRDRIDALLPQLEAAEKAEGGLLQNLAIDALEKKKAQNLKYLIDTRFALARVYDSELKGTAAGDSK